MNILFTICGRAGSKGIKNKNIMNFLGFPLPYYTISVIELYKKENPDVYCDVVLNTDSQELIQLMVDKLNIPIDIIERNENLGLDNTPKIDVIRNCYELMKCKKAKEYDIVVDLDITSPLRTISDVNNLINEKIKHDVDIVFSVTPSRRNPYFNMVKETDHGYDRVITSNYNTRQEAPEIFDMNASLYAYSPNFLLQKKGIFEGKCGIIIMQDTGILDLDHKNDIDLMQVIAKYLYDKQTEYGEIRSNISTLIK